MKRILVTQRVDINPSYGERRDALDQKWIEFLLSINLWPITIPNSLVYLKKFVEIEKIDGVLLTGGNSLAQYDGNAQERDEMEYYLLEWAIDKNIPILGVCRGMQVIQNYFDNRLIKISEHVDSRFTLEVVEDSKFSLIIKKLKDVNAFHDYGAYDVSGDLLPVAYSSDGIVMAIEHIKKSVYGVMWHIERETPFRNEEKNLFKEIFCKGLS
jgi:N5-(cytidine 5'-diphosphoramidyl)-L-glutamine hydrolase